MFKLLINQVLKDPGSFSLAIIALAIPLPVKYGNLAIIIALVIMFANMIITKKVYYKNFLSYGFLFPLICFLGYVVSACYSKFISEGFIQVEKQLLMIAVSVVVYSIGDIEKINTRSVLRSFYISTVLSSAFLLVANLIKALCGSPDPSLFFHDFTAILDQHPVYFSTYCALSIFLIVDARIKSKFKILFVAILSLSLIFCSSKAILLVLFPLFLFKMGKNIQKKYMIFPCVLLLTILLVPNVRARFVEGLKFDLEPFQPTVDFREKKLFNYDERKQISDLELRYLLFNIATYHCFKDGSLILGYGIGDVQKHLDYHYMSYNLAPNWFEGYNVHNQYLHIMLSFGAIGLLLLFTYLLYSLWKSKDINHRLFLGMMLFLFLFEVFLTRNKGIVFFFFFNSFYLVLSSNLKTSFAHD